MPSNDFETRKQNILNSNNKIIDPSINQQIFDLLREQVKHYKQSFEHILTHLKQQSREQLANNENNELTNDTKELQDQVNSIE